MGSTDLYLAQMVYDEIITHAREGKPQEVCGIVRGRGDQAFEAVRCRNVAPDPIHDYEIDPKTLPLQLEFEEIGDEMVAIYHSHPATGAYPSASDAWNAYYPDSAYLICSLANDEKPVVRAFSLVTHDLALDLATLRAELDFDETRPGRLAYYQAPDAPVPPAVRPIVAQVPAPFYIVFELPQELGKNPSPRIVSVTERHIQIVPN